MESRRTTSTPWWLPIALDNEPCEICGMICGGVVWAGIEYQNGQLRWGTEWLVRSDCAVSLELPAIAVPASKPEPVQDRCY